MRVQEPMARIRLISAAAKTGVLILFAAAILACGGDYGGPKMPRPVGEDLFEDGSAVVRLGHATDGDTATFIVGNESYATRFLAVNTPELTHQVYGVEPWARSAQLFTREALETAEEIVLELDRESDTFDNYDRLLAWIWVDGELLNYKLVQQGYAWVMYLYGDYKYNDVMIQIEAETRATGIRIHGEDDPDYDYEKTLVVHTTESIRDESLGKRVRVEGVVTAKIGSNAFIQQGDRGIYVYTAQKRWQHLVIGREIAVIGTLSEYNSLLEISNIEEVALLSENGAPVTPMDVAIDAISEEIEAVIVRVDDATIEGVEPHTGRGYNVMISQAGARGVIRIDQYLIPYIEPDTFVAGTVVDIVAPVGQFGDAYQLMLPAIEQLELQE